MIIQLENKSTRDIKRLKYGVDWWGAFSPILLGIPHFIRRQWLPAAVLLTFNIVTDLLYFVDPGLALSISIIVFIGAGAYFGRTGQANYAKHLLSQDYEFSEPETEITREAKKAWGIL